MSIGEFARRSRLSPKALRLYNELGLLTPARVDDDSGYRYCEAFIHLGPGGQTEPAQWQLITQSLQSWSQEHMAQPTELGARITYLADATVPESESQGPDCDFALPIA
jgi:hypothetical protein